MPVLSIGEIKDMITLHKKLSYIFFGLGNLFRQFWEHLEEIRIGTWAEFRPQIMSKKITVLQGEMLANLLNDIENM